MAIFIWCFSQFMLVNIDGVNSHGENMSTVTGKETDAYSSEDESEDSFLGISISKELTPLIVFLVVGILMVIGIGRFHRRRSRRPKSQKRKKKRRRFNMPLLKTSPDNAIEETDLCSSHPSLSDATDYSPPTPPSVPLFINEDPDRPPPPSYDQAMTAKNTTTFYT